MPPSTAARQPNQQKPVGPDHMLARPNPPAGGQSHGEGGLPAHRRGSIGPTVGIIIILALLALGALYFWGASMNREQEQLPLIPGDSTQEM